MFPEAYDQNESMTSFALYSKEHFKQSLLDCFLSPAVALSSKTFQRDGLTAVEV